MSHSTSYNPFFIATTARSGSTLLMRLLTSTGYVQEVDEHLAGARHITSDKALMQHWDNIPVDKSQIWGAKADARDMPAIEGYFRLEDIKPSEVDYIWLRRRDKINQAISHCRLMRTGVHQLYNFQSDRQKEYARDDMPIPPDEINQWAVLYFMCEQVWESYFERHGIKPYILYYEDFMEQDQWGETIRGVLDFLFVNYEMPLSISTDMVKQSHDEVSQNYDRLIDHNQAQYDHFKYPRHFWKDRL